jgi:hypothetical protein
MGFALLGLCIGLAACAETYPNGAVKTGEQAIAIALPECGSGEDQPLAGTTIR